MVIETRDFGETEIDEGEIVTFEEPIFGFDAYRRFVLLYQEDAGTQFAWLQSVEEPSLCFILADPALLEERYEPEIPERCRKKIQAGSYVLWVVMVVQEEFRASTVNLKSPIVVNPETKRAAQIILEENLPLRYPLFERKGEQ